MKKITLTEYTLLNKDKQKAYDLIVSSTKGHTVIDYYNGKDWESREPKHSDIWDFMWSEVMEIKQAVQGNDVAELARLIYGIPKVENVNVIDVFTSFNWIAEAVEQMLKTELQELSSDDTNSDLYKPLQRFGEFPLILSIMETLKLTEKEALALPYHKVFMTLCYNKTVSEIEKTKIKNDSKAV